MIIYLFGSLALVAIGFGLGRIKNAQKLAKIQSEVDALKEGAVNFGINEYKAVVSKIQSWL